MHASDGRAINKADWLQPLAPSCDARRIQHLCAVALSLLPCVQIRHIMLSCCACRIREMRQPQAGCNAPSAIITAAAQFVDIADVTARTCSTKPIDYSYSLGYHVRASDCSCLTLTACKTR